MKKIVILGGGFAGIKAGITLIKAKLKDTQIILIDKNSYHLFTPSLYEVANSEEPQKNIAIPFSEIFREKINLIQAEIKKITPNSNSLEIISNNQNQTIFYDYLIIALGSEANFMNIEGLEKYSFPLKNLNDAIKIRDKIKSLCCSEGKCNRKTKVIIGGGSFSGCELAAEMLMYKEKLAKQNKLDPNCLDISILQGSNHLLNELDPNISKIAQTRIKRENVHYLFGGHIKKVTDKKVFTDNNNSYDYDILIWTGGVMANHITKISNFTINKHNGIIVNENLQAKGFPNIFAIGDIAAFTDQQTQKSAPQVAQIAEDMGKTAAFNIINLISKKPLRKYTINHFGYIIPLKGHFAVAQLFNKIQINGFLAWALQQLVYFYYLLTILPFYKAFKRWNKFEIDLKQ